MRHSIDEVLVVPYKYCCFWSDPRGRIADGSSVVKNNVQFPNKTSPADLKATAVNRMHSNDLKACGKRCWVIFRCAR